MFNGKKDEYMAEKMYWPGTLLNLVTRIDSEMIDNLIVELALKNK